MADNYMYEPVELYNLEYKNAVHQNAIDYFDNLVNKSNVNVEENRNVVKKYKQAYKKLQDAKKALSKVKTAKVVTTVFMIIGFVAMAIGLFLYFGGEEDKKTCLIIFGIGLLLAAIMIIIKATKLKRLYKEREAIVAKLTAEVEALIVEAKSILSPLNSMFDWNMPVDIINKSTNGFLNIDRNFDVSKFLYLNQKYNLPENDDPNSSTELVVSGKLDTNPFIILKTFNTQIINKTYTGTKTISWTTTSTDSQGRVVTHHHSETLVATVVKPAPIYFHDTVLIYGNEACPSLSFTRYPTDANSKSDQEIDKMIKKGEKELDKRTEKAIKEGKNFTRLGNSEFEVLFDALDRTNEVEYRMMFTPLAQREIIQLIRTKQPYGDDFKFAKRKMLNYISSKHSQSIDYKANPKSFTGFDIDEMKERFVRNIDIYFRSIFFDLAPLIAIPIYQETKSFETIYNIPYPSNITSFEQESMANSLGAMSFAHPETRTNVILKTSFIKKDGDADNVKVTAYSYKTIPHVEHISKFGGDGFMHDVPVEWLEYIPLVNEGEAEVKNIGEIEDKNSRNKTINDFLSSFSNGNDVSYERGMVAVLLQKIINKKEK